MTAFWIAFAFAVAFAMLAAYLDVKLAESRRDANDWRTLAEAYRAKYNAERITR